MYGKLVCVMLLLKRVCDVTWDCVSLLKDRIINLMVESDYKVLIDMVN